MIKKLKTAIIGCGRQNIEDHLPAVLKSKKVELDSIFDIDKEKGKQLSQKFNTLFYYDLDLLLSERQIDIAIVAVPHNEYLPIIKKLAEHKVHILKEKPLAINLTEANQIKQIVESNNIKMMITLQRRFNPIYQAFIQLVDQIGSVYNIDARYTLNINKLDEGWRSKKSIAGGGCFA
jgi:predicted dehydrogenase